MWICRNRFFVESVKSYRKLHWELHETLYCSSVGNLTGRGESRMWETWVPTLVCRNFLHGHFQISLLPWASIFTAVKWRESILGDSKGGFTVWLHQNDWGLFKILVPGSYSRLQVRAFGRRVRTHFNSSTDDSCKLMKCRWNTTQPWIVCLCSHIQQPNHNLYPLDRNKDHWRISLGFI